MNRNPQWLHQLKQILTHDEDNRARLYNDKTGKTHRSLFGKLTIGIGHNIEDKGLPPEVIDLLFTIDVRESLSSLYAIFGEAEFKAYSWPRQHGLTCMMFQLGEGSFRGFYNTVAFMKAGDWKKAQGSAYQSKWATIDSPERARRVIKMWGEETYDSVYRLTV